MSNAAGTTDALIDDQRATIELCHRTIASLRATITELTAANQALRVFEKRRVYASPERWKELFGYEVECKQLKARLASFVACPHCGVQGGEHDARCIKQEEKT